MIICNLSEIPDKKFKILGLVKGVWPVSSPSADLTEAMSEATGSIIEDADSLGADAIVNFTYTSIGYPSTSIIAYGTAVKFI